MGDIQAGWPSCASSTTGISGSEVLQQRDRSMCTWWRGLLHSPWRGRSPFLQLEWGETHRKLCASLDIDFKLQGDMIHQWSALWRKPESPLFNSQNKSWVSSCVHACVESRANIMLSKPYQESKWCPTTTSRAWRSDGRHGGMWSGLVSSSAQRTPKKKKQRPSQSKQKATPP